MRSLITTLSLRSLRRRWVRALLILLSIAAGVSMLVATRALNQTMSRAAATAATPLAGVADLLVTNGDSPVDRDLATELRRVEGVLAAHPRIFIQVKLPDLDDRPALFVGLDLAAERGDGPDSPWQIRMEDNPVGIAWSRFAVRRPPVIVGAALEEALAGKGRDLRVQAPGSRAPFIVRRVGTVSGAGPAAALAGDVLIFRLEDELGRLLGLRPWQVSRIDLTLQRGADRAAVQAKVASALKGRGEVRTPEEQTEAVQSMLSSLQAALMLCGAAALVVGLFLVYNALAVTVAERRHEVGVLRALGATRGQVVRLFTAEAALLGLAGSLLGIPLGLALAQAGLAPMRDVLSDLYLSLDATAVEAGAGLLALAAVAGMATACAAGAIPSALAARESPADAVRAVPPAASWRRRSALALCSGLLLAGGAAGIAFRDLFPLRMGMYGGLGLVVLGGLLAAPLAAAGLTRLLSPLTRRGLGVEGRLAADNLVRAPGRTGLVIAALAAGVALVVQTAGVTRSIRTALRDWARESIAADLLVTSGSPVRAGGRSEPMTETLGSRVRKAAGADAVLPSRVCRQPFGGTQVLLRAVAADEMCRAAAARPGFAALAAYRALASTPTGAVVSNNFAALHGVNIGDTFTLPSPNGPVGLRVVGRVTDYSWSHGSVVVNRALYLEHWADRRVDVFDVYLPVGSGEDALRRAQETVLREYGAAHGLFVLTREEMEGYVDAALERVYGVAFAQQVAVMVVAGLGVVTALLISVLQRRREMGLLRAVGATRAQVIRSVLAEALLMGIIGTAIGLLVGGPLQWYALRIVMVEETGFVFPVLFPWGEAVWVALGSVAAATLAGLGPAFHATRQRITELIAQE